MYLPVLNRDPVLSQLLLEAYTNASKKAAFLTQMATVTGVLCSHESEDFCYGYARCLRDQGCSNTLSLAYYHAGAIHYAFLVGPDTTAFVAALELEKHKVHRKVETPRKVPPFYYEWAFDAILKNSGKTWNVKTIERIEKSWPHMEVFRRLAPNKFNLLAVKKVMES